MSKYKLESGKNLVKITRRYRGKILVNEREMKMFEENLLPGFFHPKQVGKHKMVYTAPESIALCKYIKNNLTVHKFYNILAQIVEITKKVEIYKFYMYNLILDTNLIYVKEMTGEVFFLYEPVIVRDNSSNVFAFLADLSAMIKTEDLKLETECKTFRDFLSNPDYYRIEHIESFILERYPQIYQQITRAESGAKGYIKSSKLPKRTPGMTTAKMDAEEVESGTTLLMEDEEQTTLLDNEDGTVLLSGSVPQAELIRKKNSEIIQIQTQEFHIGKGTDQDYCIRDNPAISRSHAVLLCRDGVYYIRDESSTNHTYINSGMITPGNEEYLNSGDILRLADEEFEFHIN